MQQMSCPCGVYHGGGQYCCNNSYSMYYSTPSSMAAPPPAAEYSNMNYYYSSDSNTGGEHQYTNNYYDYSNNSSYSSNSSSPPVSHVDCTLSLGNPSTRRDSNNNVAPVALGEKKSSSSSSSKIKGVSNFCWDFLQTATGAKSSKSSRSGGGGVPYNGSSGANGDPLVARRCANCDTTSTPLWRNGPRGPKSLCNACGIRYKKEERSAAAASTTTNNHTDSSNNTTSSGYYHHHHKVPQYTNDYGYVDGQDSLQFLSWRLNVTDQHRPTGLVHDYTC